MAVPVDTDTAPLGISVPGVPRPDPVEEVTGFERAVARNLRQPASCGRDWIRRLIDDPSPEAEAALAKLIADSGARAIRENEAGMRARMLAAAEENNRLRRAVETVAANARLAPASFPPELRDILAAALGRPY